MPTKEKGKGKGENSVTEKLKQKAKGKKLKTGTAEPTAVQKKKEPKEPKVKKTDPAAQEAKLIRDTVAEHLREVRTNLAEHTLKVVLSEEHQEIALKECYNGEHSGWKYPLQICKTCPGFDAKKGTCTPGAREIMKLVHTEQDEMGRKRRIRFLARAAIKGVITQEQLHKLLNHERVRHGLKPKEYKSIKA